jgi:5-methylthioribose kinase
VGDAFNGTLFADPSGAQALEAFRVARMRRLFQDSVGFAGAKMTRRILGLAHVEDLESIADPDRRARCELRALSMARLLMVERAAFTQIGQVRSLAEDWSRT